MGLYRSHDVERHRGRLSPALPLIVFDEFPPGYPWAVAAATFPAEPPSVSPGNISLPPWRFRCQPGPRPVGARAAPSLARPRNSSSSPLGRRFLAPWHCCPRARLRPARLSNGGGRFCGSWLYSSKRHCKPPPPASASGARLQAPRAKASRQAAKASMWRPRSAWSRARACSNVAFS